ncbi:VQ motif-containing protein 11-like [Andrographis paniculata]|uniref:VQ motif-containing protein 11-like n=1 Tax=Andrographis paniculata TaxID=175694 RepID=UPI0021E933FB|nr:VQ motif-containing protein 11-like [Andrographis paniculata]
MASPSPSNSPNPNPNPNITFVQADPSTFRAVVQRLTGASSSDINLHQRRRRTATKLDINLCSIKKATAGTFSPPAGNHSSNFPGEINYKVVASPVSTLEYAARRSPRSPSEEEEEAIAEKRFYLRPNPGGSDPPELLPLFPLH